MDKYKRIKTIRIRKEKKKENNYRLFSKVEIKDNTVKNYQNGGLKIW